MANKDYYNILGVSKNATQDEIKKAFRKLAHEYHPDKKGGNEQKFKEANEAYSVLGDEEKRSQYDRFGQTFSGGQGQGGFQGGFGGQGFQGFDFSQFTNAKGNGNFEFDIGDIFESFFTGVKRTPKGSQIQMDIFMTFKESVFGAEKEIKINRKAEKNPEILKVFIPAGLDDGEMVRLKEKGEPISNGRPGDLILKIHIKSDPNFTKVGQNIITNLSIKLTDALMGAKKTLETLDGQIEIKIPQGIEQGALMRVRGRGVQIGSSSSHRGDLLIKIKIEVPKKLSKQAKKLIEELRNEGL